MLAVALIVVLVPGPLGAPLRRVVNYHAHREYLNTADPLWDAPVDGAAFRRARKILPRDTTYTIFSPTVSKQLWQHDLRGAGLLFFTPALRVQHRADARWVLSYHAHGRLPRGLKAERVYQVGDDVVLVKVRR